MDIQQTRKLSRFYSQKKLASYVSNALDTIKKFKESRTHDTVLVSHLDANGDEFVYIKDLYRIRENLLKYADRLAGELGIDPDEVFSAAKRNTGGR